MVRGLVGCLVHVGDGRRPPEWAAELLTARRRDPGLHVLRAKGLTLEEVAYPDEVPGILDGSFDYLDDRLQIEALMSEKMAQMTAEQFEGVLRPAFQADEKTLIAVGAVLGFLVGELQVFLVEHLTR